MAFYKCFYLPTLFCVYWSSTSTIRSCLLASVCRICSKNLSLGFSWFVWYFIRMLLLWYWWLGGRKGIRPVKSWMVGCWHGYLSGVRCRFAYGSADATASHCFLVLILAHPHNPGQSPEGCKMDFCLFCLSECWLVPKLCFADVTVRHFISPPHSHFGKAMSLPSRQRMRSVTACTSGTMCNIMNCYGKLLKHYGTLQDHYRTVVKHYRTLRKRYWSLRSVTEAFCHNTLLQTNG